MKAIALLFSFLISYQISNAQIVKDGIAKSVGDSIDQSIARGDINFLKEIFNRQKFLSYILQHEENNPALDAFNKGFGETDYITGFASGLTENLKDGNEYTFINYSTDRDHNYYLRFRQFGENGINYHDFYLEFESFDRYYISDVFVYSSGQYLSQLLSGLYNSAVTPYLSDGKKGEGSVFNEKIIKQLDKVNSLIDKNKISKARKIFYSLPENIRSIPLFNHLELAFVDFEDSVQYSKLIDKLSGQTNDKASLFLISMDKFMLTNNFKKTIEAIDSLDTYVGDQFLDYFRGNVYYSWGKKDSAEKFYLKLEENFPDGTLPYDNLLNLYIEDNANEKALNVLNRMIKNLYIEKKDIIDSMKKIYPTFSKKEDFIKWSKS